MPVLWLLVVTRCLFAICCWELGGIAKSEHSKEEASSSRRPAPPSAPITHPLPRPPAHPPTLWPPLYLPAAEQQRIQDQTQTNLVNLRWDTAVGLLI